MEYDFLRLALEAVLAIMGFMGAFILKDLRESLRELEEKIAELPMVYVLKEDYHQDIDDIKEMLRGITNDLKKKQNRRGA